MFVVVRRHWIRRRRTHGRAKVQSNSSGVAGFAIRLAQGNNVLDLDHLHTWWKVVPTQRGRFRSSGANHSSSAVCSGRNGGTHHLWRLVERNRTNGLTTFAFWIPWHPLCFGKLRKTVRQSNSAISPCDRTYWYFLASAFLPKLSS